jgi:hypothetical protein
MRPNNATGLLDQAVVSAKVSAESRSLQGKPNPTADPLARRKNRRRDGPRPP